MDFEEDVADFGVPEFVVTGPARMEWISSHQVRISYFVRRKEGKMATHAVVWDIDDLLAAHEDYRMKLPAFIAEVKERRRLRVVGAH